MPHALLAQNCIPVLCRLLAALQPSAVVNSDQFRCRPADLTPQECKGVKAAFYVFVVQVIKMLVIVVALFAFCWLPLQTYNLLSEIYPQINT